MLFRLICKSITLWHCLSEGFSLPNLSVSWKCSCFIGRLKKKEQHTSHSHFTQYAWHVKSHIKLYTSADKRFLIDTDTERPLQLLRCLHHPISSARGVSNCLKQIIYDCRHYWLFRSQHRNQYQKPLPSIQQTTCTHSTRDLRVILPVETRCYKTL